VSAHLRTYITEKLGSVARSGTDVVGIAMALRGNPARDRARYTASALVLLSGRRIYCSSSASTVVGAIDRLGCELSRLAEERKRALPEEVEGEPVSSARVADLLESIDSRVEEILLPAVPQPERAERSPARAGLYHRSHPRTHHTAVPATCA
jgi:ribosome-associated translation inhibitor RaiA